MISLESIRGFFPEELRAGQFAKHILKEYVECLALEWIARSPWAATKAKNYICIYFFVNFSDNISALQKF